MQRVSGGPVSGNSIYGGWLLPSSSGGSRRSTGLELLSGDATSPLTIEKNLLEGCGVYNGTSHDARCENATESTGARLIAASPFSFWNNRVFGGYASQGAPIRGINAAALEYQDGAGVISTTTLVAHNFLCAQGAATGSAAAIATAGPNGGSGPGIGMFIINNLLDNGGTTAARYHVYENSYVDMTGLGFLDNAFMRDSDATQVYYRESLGTVPPPRLFHETEIGSCTGSVCLDGGATEATSQTLLGQLNYEGDLVINAPFSASNLAAIREVPRALSLAQFEVTTTYNGYSWAVGNPFNLTGPTTDFEGDKRKNPPDIGHDEGP